LGHGFFFFFFFPCFSGQAVAAALACVELGAAEATRRGAARAKRQLALRRGDGSSAPTQTGSPLKWARRDAHLLPASAIAAAEAAYWERSVDEAGDDLSDDGWLSVSAGKDTWVKRKGHEMQETRGAVFYELRALNFSVSCRFAFLRVLFFSVCSLAHSPPLLSLA
jgi:hypothetical protein